MTAEERKQRPVFSGVLKYFPDALQEVAYTSWVGNEQHNPGEPLHWAKHKSSDEADALVRHLMEAGTRDTDGIRHSAKVAWRALALLQREIDKENEDAQRLGTVLGEGRGGGAYGGPGVLTSLTGYPSVLRGLLEREDGN